MQIDVTQHPYFFPGVFYANRHGSVQGAAMVLNPVAVSYSQSGAFSYADNGVVSGDSKAAIKQVKAAHFPSLTKETRTHVGTSCAAFWMNRKPQTLRAWACFEDGPIRPTRVNGRLAWAVADIRRLLAEGGC